MAKKKIEQKKHIIRSFEDLGNVANSENHDMVFANLYGGFRQFLEVKKKHPDLTFAGINWIDDGKTDILKPEISARPKITVEVSEPDHFNLSIAHLSEARSIIEKEHMLRIKKHYGGLKNTSMAKIKKAIEEDSKNQFTEVGKTSALLDKIQVMMDYYNDALKSKKHGRK